MHKKIAKNAKHCAKKLKKNRKKTTFLTLPPSLSLSPRRSGGTGPSFRGEALLQVGGQRHQDRDIHREDIQVGQDQEEEADRL